jgi:hypothetical protein
MNVRKKIKFNKNFVRRQDHELWRGGGEMKFFGLFAPPGGL